jgi:hypothetical protein
LQRRGPYWRWEPWFTANYCATGLILAAFFEANQERGKRGSGATPPTVLDWRLVAGIGLIVFLVGITAVVSPPNTWDAMAYHMTRVVQWPCFFSQQLYLQPWTEYAIMHLDLLYGSDRFVNVVEWLTFIGSVLGVSLLAKCFGAGRRGQLVAAVACATIPEAVLEASGAMSTLAGAFWIVVAVYYLLCWNRLQNWMVALAAAAASGLAILTKGTAFIFLPCVAIACWWIGSPQARKQTLARLPVMGLVILALNGAFFVRNQNLSGSPLGFSNPFGSDTRRE